jgi:hypothetical protein
MVETPQGVLATEYQWRALAVLEDNFFKYKSRKYRDHEVSIFAIDEFKPMFNEIHRAVVWFMEQGRTSHEALVEFLRPIALRSRKDEDELSTESDH